MVRLFERLGGVLRLGDPVTRIDTAGNRATDVTTRSGWHGAADMVACNGDLMHSYRDLLGGHPRGAKVAKGLARKRWSPSLRSEEHTSELQSLMRTSYAVFCLKKKKQTN